MSTCRGGSRRSFVREHLATINAALAVACELHHEPVTPEFKAAIGYFILREARVGLTEVDALARVALEKACNDPDVLGGLTW